MTKVSDGFTIGTVLSAINDVRQFFILNFIFFLYSHLLITEFFIFEFVRKFARKFQKIC